jgi:hypothetical protein
MVCNENLLCLGLLFRKLIATRNDRNSFLHTNVAWNIERRSVGESAMEEKMKPFFESKGTIIFNK